MEEEMATHPSVLAWEIPWAKEPGGLQPRGHKVLDTTEWLNTTTEEQAAGLGQQALNPT